MLPSYTGAEQEKMRRHGHAGPLHGGKSFMFGGSTPGAYLAQTNGSKLQPRSQSMSRRRRQLLVRLGLALGTILSLLYVVVPASRPLISMPLALFRPAENFHLETVRYYDLSEVQGTAKGWERGERVLLCAPLRDASPHLPMFFSHLNNLTYPHNLIDLAFLVGDSGDDTVALLTRMLAESQADPDPKRRFGEVSIIEKDFGQKVNQDVESRHGFAAQASRRKSMAQARNWLLSAALRPSHSWVYWRDVDVETAPTTILEDLMRHNKDVIVPNVWRPLPDWLGGEQPYDLNSWQESETALALADSLDEDAVIVEGYAEYATWRPHLAYLRDPYGDPDVEMEIDGVGGVSILAKAKVFRSGVHFPAFSFERHAETEGFGKMAKRMEYSVVGLPHYVIWHLYEPSVDDIRHMEEMEREKAEKEEAEFQKAEAQKKTEAQFEMPGKQWEDDKTAIRTEEEKEHAAAEAAAGSAKEEEQKKAQEQAQQQQQQQEASEEERKHNEKQKEYEQLAKEKQKEASEANVDENSIYGPDGKARIPGEAELPAQPAPPSPPPPPPQMRKPPAPANVFVNGEAPARRMDG